MIHQKLPTFGATERTWAMKMQLSGGLEPTTYNGRAKDARPSTRIASRWRGFPDICPAFSGVQGLISTGDVKAMLKATLADTTEKPYYEAELKWATTAHIYTLLHQADSLMSGDTLLTAFYDSCWSANMGKLYRASEVAAFPMVLGVADKYVPLSADILEDYIDTLESMTATIIPEDAFRDVLVIAFEKHLDTTEIVDSLQLLVVDMLELLFPDSTFATPMKKNEAYTETQLTAISSIAEECPSEFGNAVYIVRAMLSRFDTIPYHYEHECEIAYLPPSERRAEEELSIPAANENFKIYPNPANGILNIEMNLLPDDNAFIELYTLTGAKVKMASLRSERTMIDVSDCQAGIYFYRISINATPHFFGKQVIVK